MGAGHLQDVVQGVPKRFRAHVIGVTPERFVPQRSVRRGGTRFAPAPRVRFPLVGDTGGWHPPLQFGPGHVGMAPRTRRRAHIYEHLFPRPRN